MFIARAAPNYPKPQRGDMDPTQRPPGSYLPALLERV